MTIKVIGAGFGRTGTMSLKVALEKLGFEKCHHMMEVFLTSGQIDYWARIADDVDPPDWDDVFEGFQATTDFPACSFYAELAHHYPDAKVILTIRDPDSWYESVYETIFQVWRLMPRWLLVIPLSDKAYRAVDKLVWENVFEGHADDPVFAKQVYEEHNAAVQRTIPSDRLLVYQVNEGWGPLCKFLGVAEPEEPFPRVNDRAEMKRRIIGIRALRVLPYLLLAGLVALLLV